MASSQNSIPNSGQIDLDIFSSDIDEHNLESAVPGVQHHLQVILPCQCCLHRETLGVRQVLRGRPEHLAGGRNGKQPGRRCLERVAIASGSRRGISLNSAELQRVKVVLPEPLAPAMNVSVGRVTWRKVRTSFGAQPEFPAGVFSQLRPRRGLPAPSFAPSLSSSQPCVKDTPTPTIFEALW